MLFSSWLRNGKASCERRATRRQRSSARRLASRLCLETLEDRVVPASLSYSTLLDGTVLASAVDRSGDIYVTGYAGSNLPTTPGAFQTTGSGTFVAKLNPTGTNVLYATYLGNDGGDNGIAIDAAGDAYVIGESSTIPTTPNAIASSPPSGTNLYDDVFVAELNPTGSGLLYSTYVPGAVGSQVDVLDSSGSIAVDGSGNIYLAGAAQAGLPVTANAFQTAYLDGSNGSNAFFMKINPALSGTASILYASYLGGSGFVGDAAGAIALDGSGNAYLYGSTSSSNFPTTSGAVQRAYGGDSTGHPFGDAFVAKFNPALSGATSLVFSTYLGGSGQDGFVSDQPNTISQINPAGGIAVDSAGNVYVAGSTTSTNFPTTRGAYQTASNIVNSKYNQGVPSDVFVTKLNATGSALIYSTYLGGGGNPYQITHGKTVSIGTLSGGSDIAVDASGDAYVAGWTNSTSFPTKDPIQATNNGGTFNFGLHGWNSFVTELNPAGSGLLFSTYLGGSSADFGFSIALDSANNVYVAGQANSTNFPTTPGAYDTTSGPGFVAKISGVNTATAMPAIAATLSGTTASAGSPQAQKSNGQPASSQADQLFTLVGNNPGFSTTQAAPSVLPSDWQSLESALLARFDEFLGLDARTMEMSIDSLIRDLLFASMSSSNG